jgi:hypothetical protein
MGVKVTGVIEPVSLSDTYPVIDPLYGIDGLRCVDTVDDMYNIPLERRRGGMVVGIPNTLNQTVTYYKLKPGISWTVGTLSVTDWDPFFGSGKEENYTSCTIIRKNPNQFLKFCSVGGEKLSFLITKLRTYLIILMKLVIILPLDYLQKKLP